MNLLDLPDFVLEEIFQHLSYDDIAKKRLVSKKINRICQSLLNRSVVKLQSCIASKIRKLKPLVPRKESQRWDDSAAIKIRYFEKINLNVRLLYNVYKPYIDINLCCFIPGNVIDTSFNLLRRREYPKIMLDDKPLEEFNDQICMATEHFQEHIQPTLLATLRKLKAQKKSARKATTDPPVAPTQSFLTAVKALLEKSNALIAYVINANTSIVTEKSPVATRMDKQQTNKCQLQDHDNCRKAYFALNKKYETLLRNVNQRSKAIKKQFSDSRNEIDLRRRLHKLESQNRSATVEQTEVNRRVMKTDLVRKSKRLAEAKKAIH